MLSVVRVILLVLFATSMMSPVASSSTAASLSASYGMHLLGTCLVGVASGYLMSRPSRTRSEMTMGYSIPGSEHESGVDFSAPLRGIPVTKSAIVQADLAFCYSIAADFGQTLNWASKNGMKVINVLERHEDGMGKIVETIAKPPLAPHLKNVLAYKFDAPEKIIFRSLSGNVMKTFDGSYTFTKHTSGGTLITYELAVQFPGIGVPAPLQKYITGKVAQTAVFDLKEYITLQASKQ